MIKILKLFGWEVLSYGSLPVIKPEDPPAYDQPINPRILPSGQVSVPPFNNSFIGDDQQTQILLPDYFLGLIPALRILCYQNPNFSQALNNIVELGNTGHTVSFDQGVPDPQKVEMGSHLEGCQKNWGVSAAGVNNLVNKMISQIMISGALSNEWVPRMDLKGIKTISMVNPETVRWGYDRVKQLYRPYQAVTGVLIPGLTSGNLIELNPYTFKYFALNGDQDSPYGIPPYLAGLDSLSTQKHMMDNIKFIIEQIGVMGFLEVLMEKPDIKGGESDTAYIERLGKFLNDTKTQVQKGFRDGVTVGYKGDTEYNFHSSTKSFQGVNEFFQLNELQLMSGLKQDASMMGRNYGTSESQIGVIFTKLLAQLSNVQALIKANLEYGYALELRLAGFKFKSLTVKFNASTALDELKAAQADEIKIRNLNALFYDGIISLEEYAHQMGYAKPDQAKPRVERVQVASQPADGTGGTQKEKRKDQKNKSAKAQRSKAKPRGSKK